MTRVVCAGHVNWDVTLRVEALPEADGETQVKSHRRAGGGSAANVSAALAGLGHDPLVVGSVGDDDFGPLVRQELEGAGVDCTHLQQVAGETTVKYLIVDADAEVHVLASDGVNEAFGPEDVPEPTLAGAGVLHLTGQRPGTAKRLAERARGTETLVSVDPGRRVGQREFGPVFEGADIIFLNEREAAAVESGESTQTVVKKGGDGATVEWDGQRAHHDGFDVGPVDTAGAGDAFAAGFLSALLDGMAPGDALAVGNACGALASSSVGARTGISWPDVEAVLGG
ncbi:MAG: PfkB family carbohydrate kinase [Halovenus sp.]